MTQQEETQPPGEDRRGGTPPGMDSHDVEERSEIARFLGLSAFPGTRDELLAVANENQATDHVRAQLQRLPADERFENVQDVARALGLGTEEKRV